MTLPTDPAADDVGTVHRCGNCEAVLSGPYCASCGQHAHASARNLAAVLHGAWHDITHLDGRLWLTLWLVFARPGRLTVDYFREQRARYLPPVRLYLVLSVQFFGLAINLGDRPPGAGSAPPKAAAELAAQELSAAKDSDREVKRALDSAAAELGVKRDAAWNCRQNRPGGRTFLERAAMAACVRISADRGRVFFKTLARNIPKMMFAFLPLMAGVMTLLYWRPRRYYVEHLVFVLHNHSAMFMCFLLLALLDLLGRLWPALTSVAGIPLFLIVAYMPWYVYASMRRYYAQSRKLTALKYLAIASAYFLCLLITLLGTAVITALET